MRKPNKTIMILGAYGLAGRTIARGLAEFCDCRLILAGRDEARLTELAAALSADADIGAARLETLTLDGGDSGAVRAACGQAAMVVNAMGPYALHGADIAREAIQAGASYLDVANEQIHYRRLKAIEPVAQRKGLLLATAAGVIPGASSLLAAELLKKMPDATTADISFVQFRHAYAASGLGSIMSGVLDAGFKPVARVKGRDKPVTLGRSTRKLRFPKPFGSQRCLEVPTIDTLTLCARHPFRNVHSWFYLGDQPAWLFEVIRLLKPQKRRWAYKLLERIIRPMNEREHEQAVKQNLPTETLLSVTLGNGHSTCTGNLVMTDGAILMRYIPAMIIQRFLEGRLSAPGLVTALDVLTLDELAKQAKDAIVTLDLDD